MQISREEIIGSSDGWSRPEQWGCLLVLGGRDWEARQGFDFDSFLLRFLEYKFTWKIKYKTILNKTFELLPLFYSYWFVDFPPQKKNISIEGAFCTKNILILNWEWSFVFAQNQTFGRKKKKSFHKHPKYTFILHLLGNFLCNFLIKMI